MSLFKCEQCGCLENTALSRYWFREEDKAKGITKGEALCSGCHPSTKKWHGLFPQEPWPARRSSRGSGGKP